MDQVASISKDFERRNINVPRVWIEQCIQFLMEDEEIQQALQKANSSSQINELVYEQYLLCDLASLDHPYLQNYYNNNNNITQLERNCVVQVNYCVDISQSYYSQLKAIAGVDDGNAAVDADNDTQNKWAPKPAKGCMLEVTDGINAMKAYESEPINLLRREILPGCKVVLKAPITISEGCLLLKKNSLVLLGGHVEELAQTFEPTSLFKHLIKEKKSHHQRHIECSKTFSNGGKLSASHDKITPKSESKYKTKTEENIKAENKASDGFEEWDDWENDSFADALLLSTDTIQPLQPTGQKATISATKPNSLKPTAVKREPTHISSQHSSNKQLKQAVGDIYKQQNTTAPSNNPNYQQHDSTGNRMVKSLGRQTSAATSNNPSQSGFKVPEVQTKPNKCSSLKTFQPPHKPAISLSKSKLSPTKNEPQEDWSDVDMDFDDDFEEEISSAQLSSSENVVSNEQFPQTFNPRTATGSSKLNPKNYSNITNPYQQTASHDQFVSNSYTVEILDKANMNVNPVSSISKNTAAVTGDTKSETISDEEIIDLLSSSDEFEQMDRMESSNGKLETIKLPDKSENRSHQSDKLPECSSEHQLVFSYISAAKSLPVLSKFTVKAHVSTALNKIEVIDKQYWNVRVRINDGTGYLDCDIHHQIIEEFLGPCTKKIKRDPVAKWSFIQNAERLQEYLSKLNAMLSIEKKSIDHFIIYEVNSITETHIKQFTNCLRT